MSGERRKVLIALGSAALFGAERRFFRILKRLQVLDPEGVEIHLVLNSSLYIPARNVPWIADVLSSLRAKRRLTVVPDNPAHLGKAEGLARFVLTFFTADLVHAVLRGRAIAYLRAIFGLSSLIEVTSPEIADRLGRGLPLFFMKRISFVCVSPSVYKRFSGWVEKRFGDRDKPDFDIACASIPFFEASEVSPPAAVNKEKWIVSASRFLERKNVHLFAQCVADALPDLEGWKVYILGQGPEEPRIQETLADAIERGQVVVGYDPKIAEILIRSALYVSIIQPDSYPSQSVLEAMSFKNALMLGDAGDSRKFLGDDMENGVLVPIEREAITQAIRQAVADFPKLIMQGEASARILEEKFGAVIYTKELLARYASGRASV